jgi:hypothetical protein
MCAQCLGCYAVTDSICSSFTSGSRNTLALVSPGSCVTILMVHNAWGNIKTVTASGAARNCATQETDVAHPHFPREHLVLILALSCPAFPCTATDQRLSLVCCSCQFMG